MKKKLFTIVIAVAAVLGFVSCRSYGTLVSGYTYINPGDTVYQAPAPVVYPYVRVYYYPTYYYTPYYYRRYHPVLPPPPRHRRFRR